MSSVIFLGTGASPGVPSLSYGFGDCDPENPKNIRSRTSTLYNINGTQIMIDTSPDFRSQCLECSVRTIDGVCYTHAHSDHLHGIDDLREINRIMCKPVDIYACMPTMKEIKKRFGYLFVKKLPKLFYCTRAGITPHTVKPNRPFFINGVKVVALKLLGHNMESYGYIINDEIVHLADFKVLSDSAIEQIKAIKPKLMVIPLTVIEPHQRHVGLSEALDYVKMFQPEHVFFNHMACECDYEYVNNHTPDFVEPAYDGLKMEW